MSPKRRQKVMRMEIHTMVGSPLVIEDVSSLNILISDGGWLGILPGHAPLVAATEEGEAFYTTNAVQKKLHINAGILSVADNVVSILTTK